METREIKFRAWMGDISVMLPQEGSLRKFFNDLHPETSDTVLMQFTGLKDKNGVEIYEGDLLADESFVQWCEVCVGWRNFWNDGHVDICHECDGDYTWNDLKETDDFRIIGNLYENPELLSSDVQNVEITLPRT